MAELYHCSGIEYVWLATASLNSVRETWERSPVVIIENSSFDLLHGLQVYSWCIRYTCQQRLSLFITLWLWTNPVRFTSQVPAIRCHIIVARIWLGYKDLLWKLDINVSISMGTSHCSTLEQCYVKHSNCYLPRLHCFRYYFDRTYKILHRD